MTVPEHKPYVSDDVTMPEFTWGPLLAGSLLGIIYGASSLYLVLKVGVTVSASIPVAVLSTPSFDAPNKVDTTSLKFGRTGSESSLIFCNKSAEDVNGDWLPDLICHFDTQATGFQTGDTEGILKGQTVDGVAIEGRDSVRIVH